MRLTIQEGDGDRLYLEVTGLSFARANQEVEVTETLRLTATIVPIPSPAEADLRRRVTDLRDEPPRPQCVEQGPASLHYVKQGEATCACSLHHYPVPKERPAAGG